MTLSQEAYDDTVDLFVELIRNGTSISFGELLECFDDPDGEAAAAGVVALDLHWDVPTSTVITVADVYGGVSNPLVYKKLNLQSIGIQKSRCHRRPK